MVDVLAALGNEFSPRFFDQNALQQAGNGYKAVLPAPQRAPEILNQVPVANQKVNPVRHSSPCQYASVSSIRFRSSIVALARGGKPALRRAKLTSFGCIFAL